MNHLEHSRRILIELSNELGDAETVAGNVSLQFELMDRQVRRTGGEHWWTCRADNMGLGETRTV